MTHKQALRTIRLSKTYGASHTAKAKDDLGWRVSVTFEGNTYIVSSFAQFSAHVAPVLGCI